MIEPFDFEIALSEWSKSLHKARWIEPADLEELKLHVRDKYQDLLGEGKAGREAFELAIKGFGEDNKELSNQYRISRINLKDNGFKPIGIAQLIHLQISASAKTILRKKGDFFTYAVGLVVAFTTAIFINQYLQFEENYDTFYPDHELIYRISAESFNTNDNSSRGKYGGTFYATAPAIKEEVPELEATTRLRAISGLIQKDESVIKEENMFYGDAGFFEVFSPTLVKGNPNDLDQANSIYLSEEMAAKYFQSDPMGQSLKVRLQGGAEFNLEVRGVFKDFPKNVHLPVKVLISNRNYELNIEQIGGFGGRTLEEVKWRLSAFLHYAKVNANADINQVEAKLNDVLERNRGEIDKGRGVKNIWVPERVDKIHLGEPKVWEITEKGDATVLLFLKLIMAAVLVLAWVNYVNLAVAKSIIRAKEVGIMKAIGSSRKELVVRFFMESVLVNLVSLGLAILLAIGLMPLYQELVGNDVFQSFNLLSLHWTSFSLFILSGVIISSIYPALILASFKPTSILKGRVSTSTKGTLMRKGLVVFQFSICLVLMIFIYSLDKQVRFMKNHQLGFNLRGDLIVERPTARDSITNQKLVALKNRILQDANVEKASVSSNVPGQHIEFRTGTQLVNSATGAENIFLNRIMGDESFLSFYELNIVAGRNFAQGSGANSRYTLINRKAAELFGFSNPEESIGQRLAFTLSDTVEVIGVVENFAQEGLKISYTPISIQIIDPGVGTFLSVAVSEVTSESIDRIGSYYEELFPNDPFEYFVLDDSFNKIYSGEEKYGNMLNIATMIAMLISALGIIGLASFAMRIRRREIAIRKVLGASFKELVVSLSKEYLVLAFLSGSIGIPLGYYLIATWLNSFAFRIPMEPILFILPMIAIVVMVLLLVSKHIISATASEPVGALREE